MMTAKTFSFLPNSDIDKLPILTFEKTCCVDCFVSRMELRTWLSEFKSLSDADIKSYSQKYNDEDFVRQVYEIIHSDLATSTRSIVVTLKSFITSGEPSLINFVGLLIPLLIAFYLKPENSESKADLESLFVFYMNQDAEQFKIMKLPSLQQNTIYHDANDFDHFNDKLSG